MQNRPTWRDYQVRLKRNNDLRNFLYRLRWVACAVGSLMVIGLGIKAYHREGAIGKADKTTPAAPSRTDTSDGSGEIQKQDIHNWLFPKAVANLTEKSFDIQVGQQRYHVETNLDLSLQTSLLKKLQNSDAEVMGLVALDPDDGRVLAMVGVDNDNPSVNPCLDNHFPAASVFKIITAAAAIEQCDFVPDTTFTYNGGKYTLYKSQLKNTVNRYTNTISFRDSFAESVNPVFGKIGAQYLSRQSLEQYGEAFGFNRKIDFEVTLPASLLKVPEGTYHQAEIACGFNRTTTLTPLHGAMIVSAVLNGGRLPEPAIIEQIMDESGKAVYRSTPTAFGNAMSFHTSTILDNMMTRTIRSGTCRKSFRNAERDRVLSRLEIGGKTGSIDNREHSRRMDWFVGFAREKNGTEKIAVAVVVGHGKYIGTRAAEFAKYAFEDYFKEYFAETDTVSKKNG